MQHVIQPNHITNTEEVSSIDATTFSSLLSTERWLTIYKLESMR